MPRGWLFVALTVGDGGFATPTAALALAEPGDTLAIGNGSYADDPRLDFTITLRGGGNHTLRLTHIPTGVVVAALPLA